MKKITINISPSLKCEQHQIFSTTPCPWPNCENGIAEDEFESRSEFDFDFIKVNKFKRTLWPSSINGQYYSWEIIDKPSWFSVNNIFWNEVKRANLIKKYDIDSLYHYTTLEGFMGIVESRSLWLTDFGYLNDLNEIEHGKKLILKALNIKFEKNPSEKIKKLILKLKNKLKENTGRICIASLSSESDSLSQWRAYGTIAIGIKKNSLITIAPETTMQSVIYNEQKQEKIIELYLDHYLASYEKDITNNSLNRIPDIYERTINFLRIIAFFKDPSFSSENEFRLAFIDDQKSRESLEIPSPSKKFRISNNRIIPYVSTLMLNKDIDQNHLSNLEITEVVLGPSNDQLLEQGIREFLDEMHLNHVPIRKSNIPFRS